MNRVGVQTYSVVLRHYDHKYPITYRVDVTVPVRQNWASEINNARIKALEQIKEVCDAGYLTGDHLDYEIVSTRRKNG